MSFFFLTFLYNVVVSQTREGMICKNGENAMKYIVTAGLALLMLASSACARDRRLDELTCLPVNGSIQLPGILYDDLTPLAREVFHNNSAAVTTALFALPYEEREDFIGLYLAPEAREKHQYFFARCREVNNRRARASIVNEGREILPRALRNELHERERIRLALHESSIPFRIGGKTVYIPLPVGYNLEDTPVPAGYGVQETSFPGFAGAVPHPNYLARFRKVDPVPAEGEAARHPVFAVVRHVREGADNMANLIQAYRIMVDGDWRLTGTYPEWTRPEQAETAEYKWNLEPFDVRDNSFCYGQFEKTRGFSGAEEIRYRATAIVTMPGSYIQVSVSHRANTGLEVVDEVNSDLARWRDDILAANN